MGENFEFLTTNDLGQMMAACTMILCFVGGWIAGSFR